MQQECTGFGSFGGSIFDQLISVSQEFMGEV